MLSCILISVISEHEAANKENGVSAGKRELGNERIMKCI
jgi:hypothetical protein